MCLGPRAVDSKGHARASAGPATEAQDVRPLPSSAVVVAGLEELDAIGEDLIDQPIGLIDSA
jgi:hypothetical protein